MRRFIGPLAFGLAQFFVIACATDDAAKNDDEPRFTLPGAFTATDVYDKCEGLRVDAREATYDCGDLVVSLFAGEGAGTVARQTRDRSMKGHKGVARGAPFFFEVGGQSRLVTRTAVYPDPESTAESKVFFDVVIDDDRLAATCFARDRLDLTTGQCERALDQLVSAPPSFLVINAPVAEENTETVDLFGQPFVMPKHCKRESDFELEEISCGRAQASIALFPSYEMAQEEADSHSQAVFALGGQITLDKLSCVVLGQRGVCFAGKIEGLEGDPELGKKLVLAIAGLPGGKFVGVRCVAPSGLQDPLCRAVAVVE